jgi:hypothetical protein
VGEQERININVLLGVENRQNAEKKVCFYREFRSRIPVLKGRSTSGKSAVLHFQITVFNRAW